MCIIGLTVETDGWGVGGGVAATALRRSSMCEVDRDRAIAGIRIVRAPPGCNELGVGTDAGGNEVVREIGDGGETVRNAISVVVGGVAVVVGGVAVVVGGVAVSGFLGGSFHSVGYCFRG